MDPRDRIMAAGLEAQRRHDEKVQRAYDALRSNPHRQTEYVDAVLRASAEFNQTMGVLRYCARQLRKPKNEAGRRAALPS